MSTPHEVTLASAGTGKTYRLVGRMLALLCRGEDPTTLLSATFTRAAAGEIMERVLGRLADASSPAGRALSEVADAGAAVPDAGRCLALLGAVIDGMDRLRITTYDAFFAQLARRFALELPVPPGWTLCDEREDKALRREALRDAIARADPEELLVLLRALHGASAGRSVAEAMERVIGDGYDAYLATGGSGALWTAFAAEPGELDGPALSRALAELEDAALPTKRDGTASKRWVDAHAAACGAARRGDWESFTARGVANALLTAGTYYGVEIPASLAALYRPVIGHARAVVVGALGERSAAMFEFARRFDAAYGAIKRDRGMLRFEDVPRLLECVGALDGAATMLAYRLDGEIRHLLFDEFQDTSVTQLALLAPLIEEFASVGDGSRTVLCVGDVKQSLYMWRRADPELLASLPTRFPALGAATSLTKNYRSSPVVIDAVNTALSGVTRAASLAEMSGTARRWDAAFAPHEAARADLPGAVRLSVADAPGDESEGADEAEPGGAGCIAGAARRVRDLLERAPSASTAVLLRTGRRVPEMIARLAELGVPASEERGSPLTDAPPVACALSALRLAAHPGDTASAFHVAVSPFAPAARLEGVASADLSSAARNASVIIGEAVAAVGVRVWLEGLADLHAGAMSDRSLARFRQLIDLAATFDAGPEGDPGAFVELVESTPVDERGREPVRVMTIHASKGLQFDAVVLPELDHPWRLRAGAVLATAPEGGAPGDAPLVTAWPREEVARLDDRLSAAKARAEDRAVLSELCVLYVAMTRSKRVLEMLVPASAAGGGRSAARLLREMLAPEVEAEPGAVLYEAQRGSWWAGLDAQAERPASPERADGAPSAAKRSVWSRLEQRSPSRAASEAGPLHARLRLPVERSLDRGTLVHAWFELIEWIEDGEPDDSDLLETAARLGVDDGVRDEALGMFRRALREEAVRACLSRPAGSASGLAEVWRERRFVVLDRGPKGETAPSVLQGAFDRLVRWDGGAWVIDFKTDAPAEDGEASGATRYASQLRAYGRAAAEVLGLGPERVRLTLVQVAEGGAVEIEA